jgi:hypothetical protein
MKKKQNSKSKHVKNVGDTYEKLNPSSGILKRTVEEILKFIDNKDIIWAFLHTAGVGRKPVWKGYFGAFG